MFQVTPLYVMFFFFKFPYFWVAHIWGYENKLNLFNYRGILHDLIKCKRNVADGIVPALSASLVCENMWRDIKDNLTRNLDRPWAII